MFGETTRALVAKAGAAGWLPMVRDPNPDISDSLRDFLHERLKVFLRDDGIRHDVIDACLAMDGNCDLTLLVARARALSATLKTDDGANLLQGFKRANNILTQAEQKDGVEYSFGPDPKFAEGPEETALFAHWTRPKNRSPPRWRRKTSPQPCRRWPPCARPSTPSSQQFR